MLLFRDIADWLWKGRGRRQVGAVPYGQVSFIAYWNDESVVDLLAIEWVGV